MKTISLKNADKKWVITNTDNSHVTTWGGRLMVFDSAKEAGMFYAELVQTTPKCFLVEWLQEKDIMIIQYNHEKMFLNKSFTKAINGKYLKPKYNYKSHHGQLIYKED